MKKCSRFLLVFLAVCLIVSLIGGCKPSSNASGSSKSGSEDEPAVDFGGATITVSCWVDMTPELGNSDYGDAQYYAYEYAKEKYNCDLKFISMPEDEYFNTFVSKSLSGQKFADIVTAHCWNYASWINQGLLVPVTEWMQGADDAHWEKQQPNYRNEIWGINAKSSVTWPNYYLLYNTDVLNDLNLEDPQTLAKSGEWTWDTFRRYCKAAVADTDNDGVVDRYGIASFWLPEILRMSSDFSTVVYNAADAKYYNAWTYSETKDLGMSVLQFMYNMKVTDGSVMGDTIGGTVASDEMMEAFRTGSLLFSMADNDRASTFKKEGLTNYQPVTLPLGPGVTELSNYIQSFSFYAIPTYKDYETGDLVSFWKDCQTTWDESRGDAYDSTSLDDKMQEKYAANYNSLADTEFMYEMGLNMKSVCTPESAVEFNGVDIWSLYLPILRNTKTPAAAVEATDGTLQTCIDTALNSSK